MLGGESTEELRSSVSCRWIWCVDKSEKQQEQKEGTCSLTVVNSASPMMMESQRERISHGLVC